MRFIMMVKADDNYEKGAPPPPELMAAIGELGEKQAKAELEIRQLADPADFSS